MLLWIDDAGNYSLGATADMSNYVTTTVAPTPGVWEHVVGTWDGAMLRLYLNGVQIGSKPFTGPLGSPTLDFEIANYHYDVALVGFDHFFGGALDDVALYGRALSPAEIKSHYLGCADIAGATNAARATR